MAGKQKLTDDEINEVKYFYMLGAKNKDLASSYRVSSATISNYTTVSKEKQKAQNRMYYLRESAAQKEYRKRYSQTAKGKRQITNAHLKRLYGITFEQKQELLKQQKFCCAICERPETNFKKGLSVDHNHETGRVRGLLCVDCNTRLETIENKSFCLKASLYLQRY